MHLNCVSAAAHRVRFTDGDGYHPCGSSRNSGTELEPDLGGISRGLEEKFAPIWVAEVVIGVDSWGPRVLGRLLFVGGKIVPLCDVTPVRLTTGAAAVGGRRSACELIFSRTRTKCILCVSGRVVLIG